MKTKRGADTFVSAPDSDALLPLQRPPTLLPAVNLLPQDDPATKAIETLLNVHLDSRCFRLIQVHAVDAPAQERMFGALCQNLGAWWESRAWPRQAAAKICVICAVEAGGSNKELFLWHGTRGVPPLAIAQSGLDMRLCRR